MIKCPNCGAELNFNVELQLVTCDYCRTTFNPHTLDEKVKVAQEQTYEGESYLCSQCGATLLTFDETAITFCSYCGSQSMIKSKMMKQNNPDFIIPFKKTKEECISAYKSKVSKSLFAPNYMKSDIVVNKFRGIYIPYGIYKLAFHGRCFNKGSKYSHRIGDYKYYDDYSISAQVNAEYDGISYDLISDFYDKFSHSMPHDFKEAKPFNPNYLAGFYADAVDVDNSLYEDIAKSMATNDSINHMSKQKEFAKYGCRTPKVEFEVCEKKVGMFPIYFLAIRNKNNNYINYAVVNGQTGKVVVDLPVDFKKYILISLLLTIPIFLLINNYLVIVPKYVCIFSIIASIISIIISRYQLKKISERENHLDDIGYSVKKSNVENEIQTKKVSKRDIKSHIILLTLVNCLFLMLTDFFTISPIIPIVISIITIVYIINLLKKIIHDERNTKSKKTNNKIKINKKELVKYTYKSVIAISIGVIVLLCNFVADIYYYGASIIMFALVIWGFYDLIKCHNLLVSTKLPQLGKRGGDENE